MTDETFEHQDDAPPSTWKKGDASAAIGSLGEGSDGSIAALERPVQ